MPIKFEFTGRKTPQRNHLAKVTFATLVSRGRTTTSVGKSLQIIVICAGKKLFKLQLALMVKFWLKLPELQKPNLNTLKVNRELLKKVKR